MATFQSNPSIYNYGNPIDNFYRGYEQSQSPQNMRQEQQMNAMKQAYMKQQVESEPEMNAEKLKQLQLQNSGLGITNSIEGQKLKQAQLDAQRRAAFLKMLQGNGGSDQSNQTNTSYPYPANMQPGTMPSQVTMPPPSVMPQNTNPNAMRGQNPQMSTIPQINYNTPYGKTTPNNMMMNGGPSPQAMPTQGMPNQGNPMQRPMNAQQPMSGMDQIDALWANPQARALYGDYLKEMGVSGKEQLFNNQNTGEVIKATTLPSGKVQYSVQQIGETPYDRAFQSQEGRNEASIVKSMNENYPIYQQNSDDLQLINSVLGDPKLDAVMGPVWEAKLTNLSGKKEYQDLLGVVNVAAGDYYNRMLNMSKGNPSNFDAIQLLKTKIDTDKDSLGVAVGKARALNIINLTSQKREELAHDMIVKGIKPSEAMREATKQIPLNSSKKEVDALVQGKQLMYAPDGKVVSVPFEKVEEAMMQGGKMYGR